MPASLQRHHVKTTPIYRDRWTMVALLAYGTASIFAFWHNLPFDNSHLLATKPNDTTAAGWYMAWAGYAVTHLHNPMFGNWMEYPTGLNLAANQSMMLLGIIATPVTWIFGPFAMLNFTMFISLLTSGLSMFLVLRKLNVEPIAAFVGGLVFGFGPLQVAHSLENQNFTFMPLIPVIFYLWYQITIETTPGVKRKGLLLGFCCALQLYMNPEVLLESLTVLAIATLLIHIVRHKNRDREALVRTVRGSVVALATLLVLGTPFAYYYLYGPQHLTGPVVPQFYLAVFHNDLAGLIAPNDLQRIAPSSIAAKTNGYTGGAINEAGTYLGIPLLVACGYFVWRYRGQRLVTCCATIFIIGLILSCGPVLWVNNYNTGIPLPERLFTHVPLLESSEAIRYFLLPELAVAVILAVGLSRSAQAWRAARRLGERGSRSPVVTGATALVAAVLILPLVPNWPDSAYAIDIPRYFSSSAINQVPAGSTVLTYPLAQGGAWETMQWQMAADFRYKLVGGYAYIANNGGITFGIPPMAPATLPSIENEAAGFTSGSYPPLTSATVEQIRQVLGEFNVGTVIAQPIGDYEKVVTYLSAAIGSRPRSIGGVLVWYGVQRSLKRPLHSLIVHDRHAHLLTIRPIVPGH